MPGTWPAALEDCPIIGWSETPNPNIVEFDTDIGPPKRRRISSNSGTTVAAAYRLRRKGTISGSTDELQTFWTFYRTTLSDGVDYFTIKHPRTGANVTAYFDGQPQVSQDANGSHIVSVRLRMFE